MFFIDEDEIVINHKIAKEIGATHHIDDLLYKFNDSGVAMCYFSEYGWEKTENESAHMAELERIDFKKCTQPKCTRTEYEKVTESASHVIDEFENGGKFYYTAPSLTKPALANRDGVFNKLRDGDTLCRKVEKEIDERQEFIDNTYYLAQSCGAYDIEEVAGVVFDAGCRFVSDSGELD